MDGIYEKAKAIIDELASDAATKGTSDWHHFEARYNENLAELKELIELM